MNWEAFCTAKESLPPIVQRAVTAMAFCTAGLIWSGAIIWAFMFSA